MEMLNLASNVGAPLVGALDSLSDDRFDNADENRYVFGGLPEGRHKTYPYIRSNIDMASDVGVPLVDALDNLSGELHPKMDDFDCYA